MFNKHRLALNWKCAFNNFRCMEMELLSFRRNWYWQRVTQRISENVNKTAKKYEMCSQCLGDGSASADDIWPISSCVFMTKQIIITAIETWFRCSHFTMPTSICHPIYAKVMAYACQQHAYYVCSPWFCIWIKSEHENSKQNQTKTIIPLFLVIRIVVGKCFGRRMTT